MSIIINTNERFVYTGEKSDYTVKYYPSREGKAKLDDKGNFIFIIDNGGGRIEGSFKTPFAAVEYAKKKVEVKSLPKQRKYAEGKAYIYWIDEETGKEHIAATVVKNLKRYYEPVSRFEHRKECGIDN